MYKFNDPNIRYYVPTSVIGETLAFIRLQGGRYHEGVVLWAGRVDDDGVHIEEAIIPRQITGTYRYDIPNAEIFRILGYIAERGLMIPVQIHSHPGEECHSYADDAGALVQHEGGVSVVVPYFGAFPDEEFLDRVLTYRLTPAGAWMQVTSGLLIEVRP